MALGLLCRLAARDKRPAGASAVRGTRARGCGRGRRPSVTRSGGSSAHWRASPQAASRSAPSGRDGLALGAAARSVASKSVLAIGPTHGDVAPASP